MRQCSGAMVKIALHIIRPRQDNLLTFNGQAEGEVSGKTTTVHCILPADAISLNISRLSAVVASDGCYRLPECVPYPAPNVAFDNLLPGIIDQVRISK